MKSITILPLLSGLVASLPIVLVSQVSHATRAEVHSYRLDPPTRIPVNLFHIFEGQSSAPINNRPQAPSTSDAPSMVLASPNPIPTTYLLALPRTRRKYAEGGTRIPGSEAVERNPTAAVDRKELGSTSGSASGPDADSRSARMPCFPSLDARSAEAMAIGLVVILMLIAFAAEVKEMTHNRSHWGLGNVRGAIRLETDKPDRKQQFLSVRASSSPNKSKPTLNEEVLSL